MSNIKIRNSIVFNIENIINIIFCLYLLSLFFFSERSGMTIYSNLIALILIINVLFYFIINRKEIKVNLALILNIIFVLFSFLSLTWALDSNLVLVKSITLFILLCLSILLYNYIDDYKKLRNLMFSFLIYGFVVGIYLIFSYGLEYSYDVRFGQDIGNPNYIAISLSLSSIFSFYYFLKYRRVRFLFLLLFLIFIIILTGSRKSLIFTLFNLIFIIFLINRKNVKKIFKVFVISVCLISIFIFLIFKIDYFYQFIGKRFEPIFMYYNKETVEKSFEYKNTYERVKMIKFGFNKFLSKPFIGYGIDNYRVLYNHDYKIKTYSHSNFIELLVGLGIIGFIFFYTILFVVLTNIIRSSYYSNDKLLAYTLYSVIFSYIFIFSWMIIYYDSKWYTIILTFSLSYIKINNMNIINK